MRKTIWSVSKNHIKSAKLQMLTGIVSNSTYFFKKYDFEKVLYLFLMVYRL